MLVCSFSPVWLEGSLHVVAPQNCEISICSFIAYGYFAADTTDSAGPYDGAPSLHRSKEQELLCAGQGILIRTLRSSKRSCLSVGYAYCPIQLHLYF